MLYETILEAKNIEKFFNEGSDLLKVIEDSSFGVNRGETIAIVGASGCGKSTLLQLCGLLDNLTNGDILINGISTKSLNENERTKIRKNNIGFVYQMHHLFSEFTALENVIIPLLMRKENKKEAKVKAKELLIDLGLKNRINHLPAELSGGEKQRVAIARALITNPSIILADEPTGNLDDENSEKIMNLLLRKIKDFNSSLLMVTHNIDIAKKLDNIITLNNHRITRVK